MLDHHGIRPRRARVALPALILGLVLLTATSCAGGGSGTRGDEEGNGGGSPSGVRLSFLVCGDPHARTDLLRRIIDQARPDEFLVIAGDISTGKGWDEMRAMKDFLDGTGIEYYAIPGDNDMPRGDVSVFRGVFGPDHYSVERGGARLIFLNDAVPGVGCPEEQLAWLREELASPREAEMAIAFAHVPPGAPVEVGKGGFRSRETESGREMLDILERAGVPVIYCGHIHAYMLYSSGPPRVVVSGGAGADPHLSEEAGGFHHFLRVSVEGGEVREEVVRL